MKTFLTALWFAWNGFDCGYGDSYTHRWRGTVFKSGQHWYWVAQHRQNPIPGNGPHDSAKAAAKALLSAT